MPPASGGNPHCGESERSPRCRFGGASSHRRSGPSRPDESCAGSASESRRAHETSQPLSPQLIPRRAAPFVRQAAGGLRVIADPLTRRGKSIRLGGGSSRRTVMRRDGRKRSGQCWWERLTEATSSRDNSVGLNPIAAGGAKPREECRFSASFRECNSRCRSSIRLRLLRRRWSP